LPEKGIVLSNPEYLDHCINLKSKVQYAPSYSVNTMLFLSSSAGTRNLGPNLHLKFAVIAILKNELAGPVILDEVHPHPLRYLHQVHEILIS